MPAAPRRRDNIPPSYLPASTTKLDLFKNYRENYTIQCTSEHEVIKVTALTDVWSKCSPHIRIASLPDDVCATQKQYFKLFADEPGIVTLRASRDAVNRTACILNDPAFRFSDATRPDVVPAAGLSPARQAYLCMSVRPYVRTAYQDCTGSDADG
ncbi:hypothetical protein DPMN_096372 [Dreissena polymorpha]|uniref:Uncharacterized protein n=1 Tax=Dreissena polymorpha TaxID=45954 RepID=A0A9D4L882_DREPO|nr:hypothetical protein DPMN_096372 [Dreissena polymorpha]